MNEKTRYEQVLQELMRECGMLIQKYAHKLHKASHEDQPNEKLLHMYMVRKMQEDCSRVFTEATHGITFIVDDDEETIAEILEYNYDERDIEHMIKEEDINLFSHLQALNRGCIKRSDPEWSQFGIPEMLQNGKFNHGAVGSKRIQFCKDTGELVYISKE